MSTDESWLLWTKYRDTFVVDEFGEGHPTEKTPPEAVESYKLWREGFDK